VTTTTTSVSLKFYTAVYKDTTDHTTNFLSPDCSFDLKCTNKNSFRPDICPNPAWGSLQHSQSLSVQ